MKTPLLTAVVTLVALTPWGPSLGMDLNARAPQEMVSRTVHVCSQIMLGNSILRFKAPGGKEEVLLNTQTNELTITTDEWPSPDTFVDVSELNEEHSVVPTSIEFVPFTRSSQSRKVITYQVANTQGHQAWKGMNLETGEIFYMTPFQGGDTPVTPPLIFGSTVYRPSPRIGVNSGSPQAEDRLISIYNRSGGISLEAVKIFSRWEKNGPRISLYDNRPITFTQTPVRHPLGDGNSVIFGHTTEGTVMAIDLAKAVAQGMQTQEENNRVGIINQQLLGNNENVKVRSPNGDGNITPQPVHPTWVGLIKIVDPPLFLKRGQFAYTLDPTGKVENTRWVLNQEQEDLKVRTSEITVLNERDHGANLAVVASGDSERFTIYDLIQVKMLARTEIFPRVNQASLAIARLPDNRLVGIALQRRPSGNGILAAVTFDLLTGETIHRTVLRTWKGWAEDIGLPFF